MCFKVMTAPRLHSIIDRNHQFIFNIRHPELDSNQTIQSSSLPEDGVSEREFIGLTNETLMLLAWLVVILKL